MIVVDPMHNLFLGLSILCAAQFNKLTLCQGLIKTHFYHIWVQGKVFRQTKELRSLHAILADVRLMAILLFLTRLLIRLNSVASDAATPGTAPSANWRASWWFSHIRSVGHIRNRCSSALCEVQAFVLESSYSHILFRFHRYGTRISTVIL
jgi:hypothetical protein